MNTLLYKNTRFFALLVISAAVFASCDNSTGSDDHEEHSDPMGLELIHDGEVHLRYFDGDIHEPSGHHHYHAGEEYEFTVEFLDDHGDHIHAEDLEEEYSLAWVIEDETVLEIEQHSGERWSFHLVALAEGSSRVQFLLMHGNHDDFQTLEISSEDAIEFHIDADDHEDEHDDH